jgi:hypothetical protein
MYFPTAEPEKEIAWSVLRTPSAWNVRFAPYAGLASPRFDALKTVVAISRSVDLKADPTDVFDLQERYELLDLLPEVLAKTALLNLYAVLTDEPDPISNVPWWTYVKEIVRMDQERFVAIVDETLFDHVRQIVDGLGGPFAGGKYQTEGDLDFPLHYPNIPARYNCPANLSQPMVTVKQRYEQGDVQLTMSAYTTGEFLLDCDMDEDLNVLMHTKDLIIHAAEELTRPKTAETHPFLMHEYIVRDSAQQAANKIATVDLGYVLVQGRGHNYGYSS